MEFITEDNYQEKMEQIVLPFLAKRREAGTFERVPGQSLYYEHYADDTCTSTIVLLHGFTEGIGRFYETVYYFLLNGFEVYLLQQREHGRSYRSTSDPSKVNIEDYHDLVEDAHRFVHAIVFEKSPLVYANVHGQGTGTWILFGHSMGGCVASRYIELYPEDFPKAVLTSPMLDLNSGKTPYLLARTVKRKKKKRGHGSDYMPGAGPFKQEPDFADASTNCEARYLYWFRQCQADEKLQMSGATVNSAVSFDDMIRDAKRKENLKKIKADTLLVQAGSDRLIPPKGQEAYAKGSDKVKLVRVENAPHEIYRATDPILQEYWNKVLLPFLTKQ